LFSFTAAQQHGDDSMKVSSQPLSDILDRQTTSTYEPLDVMAMAQRADSYQQQGLPPQTGDSDYCNVHDYLTPI